MTENQATLTVGPIVPGSQVALFEPEYEGQVNFGPEQTLLNMPLVSSDGNPPEWYLSFEPPRGCVAVFVRIRHLAYKSFEALTAPYGVVEVEQELDR